MKWRFIVLLLLLPVLPGCAELQGFIKPGPVHSEFSRTLDTEYMGLSGYVSQNLPDARLARYFEGKAARARAGEMPPPEDPVNTKLAEDRQKIMIQAHDALVLSIQNGDWIDNGALLALAQTHFDCWVGIAASSDAPGAGEGCHQKYMEAMETLAQSRPKPQIATYSVYFNSDSAGLSLDEMDKIKYAARSIRSQPDWAAVLSGYTDLSEKQEPSRNLSMRRAVSVRNALAQQGLSAKAIRVDAFGKAPEGPAGNPQSERRVDIHIVPEAMAVSMKSSHIEDLMPEHFGSRDPVF